MRLYELRKERNLTQDDIANAIKTTRTNIGRWEKNLNEPSASFVVLLANFFEVSTDYLLGREDDFGNINIQKNSSELTSEEKELLENYRSLPYQEKAQASEYVNFLSQRRENKQNKNA